MPQPLLEDRVLRSSRLDLEPLREEHAAGLYPGLADPALYTWIPKDPPVSVETLRNRYAKLKSRRSPTEAQLWLNWACRHRAEDAYVGTVEVTIVPGGQAWMAYFVFASFQRRGLGQEACTEVLRHLYEEYQVKTVTLWIDTRNHPSNALARKLGFQQQRRIDSADFFKGSRSDEFVYTLNAKMS